MGGLKHVTNSNSNISLNRNTFISNDLNINETKAQALKNF